MRLGYSGQALGGEMPLARIMEIGKQYGMTDCELWPVNALGDGMGYAQRDVKGVKAIARREGVAIGCVTMDSAFDGRCVRDPQAYAKALCSAIDAAALLEAPRVNHYCAEICRDAAPDYARLEAYWAEPIKLAEKRGIVLALENEAHDAVATPDKMLALLTYFSSPYFRTNLDATNYYEAGWDGFPDAYEVLKDHIGYVHIKNARRMPDTGFEYVPLPDGAVNIPGLLTKIAEEKTYDGLISLEPHTAVENVENYYARESAWLRTLQLFSRG